MRPDRFITLNVVSPFARRLDRARRNLPILMYHSISDVPEPYGNPYYNVSTTPQCFAEQMQWLADNGWKGISIERALGQNGSNAGYGKSVALTFDDGFRDFYSSAWPVLQCHEFTATSYVPTHFISNQRATFKGRECMTWGEVREMRKNGIHFGSHTVTHPELYKLEWKNIKRELLQSKEKLEDEIGEIITSFAYPFAFPQEDAFFTDRLEEILSMIGYTSCATTVIGSQPRDCVEMFLRRLPVNSWDDRALLEAKLLGAYDWMGAAQFLFRKLRMKRRSAE